jgi:hypothetical protein
MHLPADALCVSWCAHYQLIVYACLTHLCFFWIEKSSSLLFVPCRCSVGRASVVADCGCSVLAVIVGSVIVTALGGVLNCLALIGRTLCFGDVGCCCLCAYMCKHHDSINKRSGKYTASAKAHDQHAVDLCWISNSSCCFYKLP